MPTRRDDATKKAIAKYQKEKCKQIAIRFSPKEIDMYDFITNSDEPISTFVKRMIREEMKKQNADN